MKKEIVNIKGTINGLVICIDPEVSLAELSTELQAKIQARPGFFKNAKFTIYSEGEANADIITGLEKICSSYGMVPGEDIVWPYAEKKPPLQEAAHAEKEVSATTDTGFSPYSELAASSENSGRGQQNRISFQDTLLIQRNLRSGQKLHYDGNLVILGDVNPGAEVAAGGDIIVMGSLRGIAHAGAFGDEKAVILAYRLEPTQLRIANRITRPPEKDISSDQPELARLMDGQMIIETYRSQKWF